MRLRPSYTLFTLHELLEFDAWRRANRLDTVPWFESRYDMFAHVHATLNGEPIDYLEFGVFQGESIRRWIGLNAREESRFTGFDTFEGLPETWTLASRSVERGYFSTGGASPDLADTRVRFIKGMFQDTLEPFLAQWEPKSRLLVHLDADLYSATLYVLCTLHRFLKPGSIVLFDEFTSVTHEFRAFMDYTAAFPRRMRPIAAAGQVYRQVCFEVIG